MIRLCLLLAPLALILGSCSNEPVFPLEPRIEYLDIQPREVRHLQDEFTISFRFEDGDGNLGGQADLGIFDLIIIDSRINSTLTEAQATTRYSLPNLTPEVRNPSIQGTIKVNMGITRNSDGVRDEMVRYQIQLVDRDGNVSKPIDGSSDNAVWTDYIRVYR